MFDIKPFKQRTNDFHNWLYGADVNLLEEVFSRRDFGKDISFKADILDEGDNYILEAELPGFEKENINIEINEEKLSIEAKYQDEEVKDTKRFIRRERATGELISRSFYLSNVKMDEIKADYNQGILRVTLPKKDTSLTGYKRININ